MQALRTPPRPLTSALLAALVCIATTASAEEQAKVEITSTPTGATVWMDGHPIGKTPCSPELKPGFHAVEIKLDGYKTWRQVVDGEQAKPAPIQAKLDATPALNAPNGLPTPAKLLEVIPADIRGALSDVIGKELDSHPAASDDAGYVWMGVHNDEVYAISVHRLPDGPTGDRVALNMAEAMRKKSSSEVFLTSDLLRQAQESGLDDLTCLRRACCQVAVDAAWAGRAPSLKSAGARCGGWVVGMSRAPKKELTANANFQADQKGLRIAYAREVSKVADSLLQQGKASDALSFYYHLHARQLTSRWNYLGVARCFQALGRKADALKVLNDAYSNHHLAAGVDWLEACGDLAANLEADSTLAKKAYEEAAQHLLTP